MATETDDAVRDLYERYPYPRQPGSLEPFLRGDRAPTWNLRDSWSLYFPEKPPRNDVDVLLAGCGTTVAPRLAAVMPEARIVAVDISDNSLEISRSLAEQHGLTNIEHVRCALENVGDLKRTFDFVESHGVLRHLADPVAGLQALGEVTRPDGALGLMVYGKHGRTGLYMLQEACRRMGLGTDQRSGERVQALLTTLSPDHPFRAVHADPGA